MSDLKLPKIKDISVSPDRILSMEQYLEFAQFNLENFFDKESYIQWKKVIAVNVPFKIKESEGHAT